MNFSIYQSLKHMKIKFIIPANILLVLIIIFTFSCNQKEVEPECEGTLSIDLDATAAHFEENDGEVKVVVSGGTPPYQYSLNEGSSQEEAVFPALGFASYSVTVKDSQGCSLTKEVEIGLKEVSFSMHVEPLITTSCATNSGCHGNGSAIGTFTSYAEIVTNANKIKSLTGDGTMPKGGSLTKEQIEMIATWVEEGAQEN